MEQWQDGNIDIFESTGEEIDVFDNRFLFVSFVERGQDGVYLQILCTYNEYLDLAYLKAPFQLLKMIRIVLVILKRYISLSLPVSP